jgi:hypothetical protein
MTKLPVRIQPWAKRAYSKVSDYNIIVIVSLACINCAKESFIASEEKSSIYSEWSKISIKCENCSYEGVIFDSTRDGHDGYLVHIDYKPEHENHIFKEDIDIGNFRMNYGYSLEQNLQISSENNLAFDNIELYHSAALEKVGDMDRAGIFVWEIETA